MKNETNENFNPYNLCQDSSPQVVYTLDKTVSKPLLTNDDAIGLQEHIQTYSNTRIHRYKYDTYIRIKINAFISELTNWSH